MVLRTREMPKFLNSNLEKSDDDTISRKKHKCPDNEDQSVSKKRKTEEHQNIEPSIERSFKCTFENCDKSYFKIKLLQRHIRQKHAEEKLLEKKKSVSNYSDGTSESSDINSGKPHKCTYDGCQAVFKKPSRLVWHIRQHTGERPFNCTHKNCDKAYATAAHLKRHEASHENVEPCIVCPSCKSTFKNRHNLKKHYHRTHSEDADRLSCNECGAKFRKKYKLDEHIAMHNGVFHECDKCKKRFSTLYLLNKHVSGSHRKKSYECTNKECAEVFDTWKMMINHRKNSHAKEFQCPKCDRNFNFKIHLKKHLASHKEDNLFTCPYDKCPKFYTLKRNLNQHINIKHLNIKFICDYCKVAFSAKNVVQRHIEKIHLSTPLPRKTNKGNRQKRKDAGIQRKSALGKLIGLELPLDVEKQLMERDAEVNFEDKLFDSPSVVPA